MTKALKGADLTRIRKRGKIRSTPLGIRLMVGQRTLDPYVEVRILDPQPGLWV
jgi:hypothetical protein